MSTETGVLMLSQMAGAYGQASATRAQGRYEAGVQNRGAAMAEVGAQDVTRRGEEAAQERLRQARSLVSKQRVAIAGQGLRVNAGTPLAIQEDTAAMGALDADTIRLNAFREAWGLKMEAVDRRLAAKNIRGGSRFAAWQTLGAGGVAAGRDYLRYKSAETTSKTKITIPPADVYGGPAGSPGLE